MIAGVELRDLIVRMDERGELTELLSVNMGDRDLVHCYRCSVRPNCVKAFHCHVGVFDQETGTWGVGQTDRFVPNIGVTKVGCVDMRGPLLERWGNFRAYSVTTEREAYEDDIRFAIGCYLGLDGTPKPFREVWPSDEAWIERVGESATFLEQHTVILEEHRPQVLSIPPGVAHGIYSLSPEGAEILNFPTVPFRPAAPDELRLPFDAFGYKWEVQSR